MNDQYKHLMQQQDVDVTANERFYEKLEKAEHIRKPIRWKVVIAAACVALMIPLTVFSAKNIFGEPKVKIGEISCLPGSEGYSIRFENLSNYSLDAFPKEIQNLTEDRDDHFDSWEEAEEALGIDLLNNTFLAKAGVGKYKFYFPHIGSTHCATAYRTEDGQLYYVGTEALYLYGQLSINLKAKITVENPMLDEEVKQILHGVTTGFDKSDNPEISYEEYTTEDGIPTIIIRAQVEDMIFYCATFAVNDISYEVNFWGSQYREDTEKQVMKDILNGFKLK